MSSDRRDFLKRTAIAAVAAGTAGAVPTAAAAQATAPHAEGPRTTFDPVVLAALGDAVLPESLGVAGRARAVRDFAAWASGYHPVSEEMHGYGDQEITYTPADPSPGWRAQLEALDLLSRRKHRKGFAALGIEDRRALLRPQLPRGRGVRLPSNIISAPHVAVALLAHWAASSDATDLAYGVTIRKDQCRVLDEAPRRPSPITERSAK